MSQLGKIFLYIAAAGGLAVAYAGWTVSQKLSVTESSLTEEQQAHHAATVAANKAKEEAEAATKAKEAADSELTETKSKVDDLTSKLATAQKQTDDLTTAVQAAKDAEAKADQQLQSLNTALGGKTPEQIKADAEKAQQDVAAAQSQQKILTDQLQASQAQVDQLKDAINRSKTGDQPPGISGKIIFVNRAWNFVVLNVGISNGVVPNGELVVYRGKNFLGKIKVTSADNATAVADVLPNAKGDIQIGDDVLN